MLGVGLEQDSLYFINQQTGVATDFISNNLLPSSARSLSRYALATEGSHIILASATGTVGEVNYYHIATSGNNLTATLAHTQANARVGAFAFAQGRFWQLSADFLSIYWFELNNAGINTTDSGTFLFADLGITIDSTVHAYDGMCGVGDNLILYGVDASGNTALAKLKGLSSDNIYKLPANYENYAFWAGEAEVGGVHMHFKISPVQLRRDRTFEADGINFQWNHTARELELVDREDTFLEIYPVVHAKR